MQSRVRIEPVLVDFGSVIGTIQRGGLGVVAEAIRVGPEALENLLSLPVVGVGRYDVLNFNGFTQLLRLLFKVDLVGCSTDSIFLVTLHRMLMQLVLTAHVLADDGTARASIMVFVVTRLRLIIAA